MNRKLLFCPLILLSILAAVAVPASVDFPPVASNSGAIGGLGESPFLPVKQAYRPTAYFAGADLLVDWQIAPGYYLYRERMRLIAPALRFARPEFVPGTVIEDEFFAQPMEVYYGQTQVRLPELGGSGILTIEAQGCAEAGLCYPPTEFWFAIDSDSGSAVYLEQPPTGLASASSGGQAARSAADSYGSPALVSLWAALLLAFAGGLLLNLMPCVFPVLALKALQISRASPQFGGRMREAIAYAGGVQAMLLGVGGAMLALRAGGMQLGWGFQLQSPGVVALLAALFLLLGLSFSGWLQWGGGLAGIGQHWSGRGGRVAQAFFTGVLAVVVASPCSAPFMAAALGYAIIQTPAVALAVFASLGLGVAAPIVLFYLLPGAARWLPPPGAWMVRLRQVLALPMYLTCLWLLWVLHAQLGAGGGVLMGAALGGLGLAVWMWHWVGDGKRWREVAVAVLLAGSLGLSVGALRQADSVAGAGEAAAFRLEQFNALLGGAEPVLLAVTADWCITCKYNEARVLHSAEIQGLLAAQRVRYVVADWTRANPDIAALLQQHGRAGIPLYLYYPAGSTRPQLLPQILTKDMVRGLFG
ncbi:MAG: thioredoxin family protein [Cellvibrionales bacterium]|nr:thioredoxin family protein [Cellvibrionales bacterium]